MHMNLQEYFRSAFVFDLKAGFITAIVALPLAIAFAIASGVHPIMGLYTAIIAGTLGSLFGGSVFSITGPTGAMTVIILSIVNKFGVEGLLLAGFLAGAFQIAFGVMGLGRFVKYIPFPVVSGFTAGIGVIILIGQIPNFLGLSVAPKEYVWETIVDVIMHASSINMTAVLVALGTLFMIFFLPKITDRLKIFQNIPPSMVALIAFTVLTVFLALQVPQVGNIPGGLPGISLPKFNLELARNVLPSALTIALLGSIEALLCAVVCDGMANTKHDSNKELKAQGIANIVIPFFGAMPATAAIARSAINIREGAKTRYAGVVHALILLLIVLFFGQYAKFIPKAFLAGVLVFVSIRMINIDEFKTIMHISRAETIVLFATFGLTVLTDLVFAVQAGMFFAIFLLFVKLSSVIDISHMEEYEEIEGIDEVEKEKPELLEKVSIYTIHGPFFFGAMNVFERKLNLHMHIQKPVIIIRMQHVSLIDSTAIVRLTEFLQEARKNNQSVLLVGLKPKTRNALFKNKEFMDSIKKENIFETTKQALEHVKKTVQ